MAYPYPSTEAAGSSSSLVNSSQTHGHGHGYGHGHAHGHGPSVSSGIGHTGAGGYREVTRKVSDGDGDVLQQFKRKIEEDESYISFFQDRLKLEEDYITGLNKLYARTVAIDTLNDSHASRKGPKPTVRKAWAEIRDYTQREAQSREAMVSAVREDVLKELTKLRDTQTRIRLGLRDNLKLSSEAYEDHLKNDLNKKKRNYYAKCQALEEHKRQESAIAMQARLLTRPDSQSVTPTEQNAGAASFPFHGHNQASSPPSHTPPLAPMSNPSHAYSPPEQQQGGFAGFTNSSPSKSGGGGGGGGRLRAASNAAGGSGERERDKDNKTKDVFVDLAQQSKRGFNAFMQKLGGDRDRDRDRDDGGFVIVGAGDSLNDGGMSSGLQRRGTAQGAGMKNAAARAMGGVKTKRDAEEADKAYRQSVFHLESLRLRREKVQQSALQNLESFNDELNTKLKAAMERYIDTMHGTGATVAQSTEVARMAVNSVNLEADMSLWRTRLVSMIAGQKVPPIPYENFYVGECRSLIFGVSLSDYDFTRPEGTSHGDPPIIVEKCIAEIDQRGLGAEGIYRISGRKTGIQQTIQDIERDEAKFQFEDKDDVYSITNVLKQYLRELPDPVFPLPHPERVKHTENRETHIHSNFSALRGRLRRLPPIHQTTFRALIEHLGRVQSHSSENKMDAKNLSVVFNSVIFGHDQLPADGNVLTMNQERDTVLEDLITFSDLLFTETSDNQAPTLLPPGSGLSRTGVISYHPVLDGPIPGSSRTKVQYVNAGELQESPKEQTASLAESASAIQNVTNPQPAVPTTISVPVVAQQPVVPQSHFTPDEELELLFDSALVPATMRDGLLDQYHVRPLAATDLLRNHFSLLSTLTSSPALAPSIYASLFTYLKSISGTYYILVIVSKATDELVASGTLFIERKYIHAGGIAGHIEDIVVSPSTQGHGLGLRLVKGLRELGELVGCYKVILDCKEEKVGFYDKCGFERRGVQMAYYAPDPGSAPSSSANAQKGPSHLLPGLRATTPLPSVESLASTAANHAQQIQSGPPLVQGQRHPLWQHDHGEMDDITNSSDSESVGTYRFPTTTFTAPMPTSSLPAMTDAAPPLPPRPVPSRNPTASTSFDDEDGGLSTPKALGEMRMDIPLGVEAEREAFASVPAPMSPQHDSPAEMGYADLGALSRSRLLDGGRHDETSGVWGAESGPGSGSGTGSRSGSGSGSGPSSLSGSRILGELPPGAAAAAAAAPPISGTSTGPGQ